MNIDMSPDCAALPSVPVLAPAFLLTPPTNEVQRRKSAKSLSHIPIRQDRGRRTAKVMSTTKESIQ